MKILYCFPVEFPNGRANAMQIAHTCHALAKAGAEVSLYVGELSRASAEDCMASYGLDLPDALSVCPVRSPSWARTHKRWDRFIYNARLRRICRRLGKRDDAFVYTRSRRGVDLLRGMPRGKTGPVRIFEMHRLLYQEAQDHRRSPRRVKKLRNLEAAVYGKVDGIVCISNGIKRDLTEEFNPSCPVRVIPSGAVKRDPRPVAKDIDVLYCGQLRSQKGADIAVQAMRWLPGRRLTMVGGHTENQLAHTRQFASDLELSDRIDFVGFVSHSEVPKYLDRAKVGVVPAPGGYTTRGDRYTSPMKLIEYMMNGLAVVASDLPSIREVVEDGVTGRLVPPNNPRALADGIRSVLEDEAAGRQMGERARELAQEFTWERRAQKILEFLDSVRTS